jgi:hypothetical protein
MCATTNHYMTAADMLAYVEARLRPAGDGGTAGRTGNRPAGDGPPPVEPARVTGSAGGGSKRPIGQRLVAFWTGDDCPADTLNVHILLTARLLRHEVGEDEAVTVIERYCREHPDPSFSDRLSAGRLATVTRVIRDTVRVVYDGNGGQPDPQASTRKLNRAAAYFRRVGFRLADKTTWHRLTDPKAAVAPDFHWSADEAVLVRDVVVPVLKTDLSTALAATKYFLRFVQANPGREVSRDSLPALLRGFDLRIRKAKKKSGFIQALISLEWLVISKQHTWHRRGSGLTGSARQYEVGSKLAYKFASGVGQRAMVQGDLAEGSVVLLSP